ncbi:RES family NAD+ phosphorylase [Alloyangia pacifica]|uniref:RES domain-containing protein n=1 Tax=Alloyangia pacifica TaxID=311180 RepID=A0A1I6RNV9_9RHOB|nr:RES domain-containing protein [Alloyangia pacifica]SDG54684.1 RES domain-containing protein [Alloyangia pacifica]SFS66433.1 RES domain-containing protein [Alloyangia pacifica]
MTHRRFDAERRAWRIGDPEGRYPIWSEGGALRYGGRWHLAGDPVIYASEHYATAMLEKLVHFAGILPEGQHALEITIPAGVSYEVFADHLAPDWKTPGDPGAAAFGHGWVQEARSAVLVVPSAVAPVERNLIFNVAHPDFVRIATGLETPIAWDARLFSR